MPPVIVKAPVPMEPELLILSVPALIVVPPVYAFCPLRVSVPAPALVRPKPLPEMTPPTVRLPPLTVTVRVAFMATAPVPRFRSFVPVKAKLPFQFCALFVERVTLEPLVLSSVPPVIVKAPVPRAELVPPEPELLILSVPIERVVMPE